MRAEHLRVEHLQNDKCPTPGCRRHVRIRITVEFRQFLHWAFERFKEDFGDYPAGAALTHHCPACRAISAFDIQEVAGTAPEVESAPV